MFPCRPRARRAVKTIARTTLVVALCTCPTVPALGAWTFVDRTVAAGLDYTHDVTLTSSPREQCSGAACGDFNGDGWLDLYFLGGEHGSNHLFRNNGDGTFSDVGAAAGVDLPGTLSNGACFADWDGDGDPDLIVGGLEGAGTTLFRNNGDGTFTDVTVASGVSMPQDTYSFSFADYDHDSDLDFFATHWGTARGPGHIWRNNGDGTFTSADVAAGYGGFPPPGADNTFTYNLADINNDGWVDLLAASDYLSSHVYLNDGDGTFTNVTNTGVIKDDNGMGNAVGDYDNDGDIDWFVSSIYNFPFKAGNYLYRNDGGGTFADVTATAGVADGSWGWGATMQDFDNDGRLDIFHVNGWRTGFSPDACRLFRNNGNGTFTDVAATVGAGQNGEGRGVVAFDSDRDGDLDIFIANNDQQAIFLRNDGLTANWMDVKLVGPAPNADEIGGRVRVTVGATTQMREIRCGSNFLSNDPAEAHFGLGSATTVNTLEVTWTDGSVTTLNNVPANQRLVLGHPTVVDAPLVEAPRSDRLELLGAAPNPFDQGTLLRFRLGETSGVKVRVIDASGRVVRTVADATFSAGSHDVAWDGRDGEGRTVGSGVYWYEVRTGEASARRKLVRLR